MPGIYIHIPFCHKACIYCDFHFSTSLKNKSGLLKSMLTEHELRKDYLGHEPVETIYFGGGTPSVLNQAELLSLLNQVYALHKVSETPEITLECNPDDLNGAYLKELKAAGINRLSIGLQSFNEEELKWMNRNHTAVQAEDCVKKAQDAGFSNISIDLIYGSKFQTNQLWLDNLNKAFDLNVQHLSAYNLTVEMKTTLGHLVKKGEEAETDDQLSATQFNTLMQAAKRNGFIHYEISNFCKEGFYSRHNSSYWKGAKYLGLGPSAHSFNGTSRQWNISNNNLYIKKINEGIVPAETEELTTEQAYNEYILTSLRTMWGTAPHYIQGTFGDKYLDHFTKKIEPYVHSGHALLQGNYFVLSDKGKLLADRIASDLFI